MKLRLATRGSRLARMQSGWVADEIRRIDANVDIELIQISTKGDRIKDVPLAEIGGKGLFVAEVEAAVARNEADLAVHSLKDIPGDIALAEGLVIASTPKRQDPRDVLVSKSGGDLASLPRDARIGTTSLRRTVQLKAQRPDLQFFNLRGNVDTRIKKLDDGSLDAIVLAAAGLHRLGIFDSTPLSLLPTDICIPAIGQGTLAIEARRADTKICELLKKLEDPQTRIATEAERALLLALQGNCHSPIAGHAHFTEDGRRLSLHALVASADADRLLSAVADRYFEHDDFESATQSARELGEEVAKNLLAQGARDLISQAQADAYRRIKYSN